MPFVVGDCLQICAYYCTSHIQSQLHFDFILTTARNQVRISRQKADPSNINHDLKLTQLIPNNTYRVVLQQYRMCPVTHLNCLLENLRLFPVSAQAFQSRPVVPNYFLRNFWIEIGLTYHPEKSSLLLFASSTSPTSSAFQFLCFGKQA